MPQDPPTIPKLLSPEQHELRAMQLPLPPLHTMPTFLSSTFSLRAAPLLAGPLPKQSDMQLPQSLVHLVPLNSPVVTFLFGAIVSSHGGPRTVVFEPGMVFVIRSLMESCHCLCPQFFIGDSSNNSRTTIVFDRGKSFARRFQMEPKQLVVKGDIETTLYAANLLFEAVEFLISSQNQHHDCPSLIAAFSLGSAIGSINATDQGDFTLFHITLS
ncbi:UNVERIFIED_CONTAM: hypothetical protein Sangu_2411500 [Sesamum angustifolium]|uniref:Uncharacterized protein n=1 Tax=Sesamum angustifolium TaxID=2727405 RepID=A0AAW2KZW4_9LAMI